MDANDERAYRALHRAATRIGAAGYAAQRRDHLRRGRSPRTYRYVPDQGHRELVDGMAALGRGRITAEDAMALLHYGESAEALKRARGCTYRGRA